MQYRRIGPTPWLCTSQPGFRFDGRSAIAELDQFPGEGRPEERFALVPEVDVVGEHQIDVLVVLAGEHGVQSVDLPWKQRYTFVLGGRAVQSSESKEEKIGGLDNLRHDHPGPRMQ